LNSFDASKWTMVSAKYTATAEWQEYTADLSAFKGKTVYVAIRHYDITDQFYLNIDDVALPYDHTLDVTFKHNCGFNDNLAIYYAVPKASLTGFENLSLTVDREIYEAGASEPTVKRTVLTKFTETTIGGAEMYMFAYRGITSTDMGCAVRAVLTAEKDGVIFQSAVDEHSIQAYVLDRLANSSNANYKKMLVDLLNYGAAAQVHFNKNPDHPVNEVLTAAQKALGTQTMPTLKDNYKEIALSGATAAFTGKNLIFDNSVIMAIRISLPSDADRSNIKLKVTYNTCNGESVTKIVKGTDFTASGTDWIAKVSGIAMTDFRSVMSIAVYNGSAKISNTMKYSVESYAYSRLNSSGSAASFKTLLREMMKFGISAETHFS
nr:choice-of-anchor J domain-containing protein [Oscillospiraceae bacterium]